MTLAQITDIYEQAGIGTEAERRYFMEQNMGYLTNREQDEYYFIKCTPTSNTDEEK